MITKTRTIETINPATGERLESFEPFSQVKIDAVLDRANPAYRSWRTTSFDHRAGLMRKAAVVLRAQAKDFARHITLEMGKTIGEAEAEIEKCAWNCDFYAEHAQQYLRDEPTPSSASESYVAYRPLGVVLAVMPWNFPFWQVFRFAAPALMAGNAAILKHASNVSRCALEIERVFTEAGFPEGVFATVIVPGGEVRSLIEDRRVAAVTLTGSEAAGISVAETSGKVLKKNVLELGGSDAFIVLADADLVLAAQVAVKARFQNAGQSCIAAKRFIVEAPVYDAFLAAFVEETKKLVVGDPLDRKTTVGPLARADLREDLAVQIDSTIRSGARIVLGGHAMTRPGFFFEPTIVADVDDAMVAFNEETFGPAAAVVRAKDAEDAVTLANTSKYGLGGNLWTRNVARAKEIAARLESGAVFINGMTASDPRLPFGGVKHSGYGRELSYFGIREFTNIQTVWIGPAQQPPPKPASE
jgi:acyl-CoA reductase-like NAD-dependent aldehyde dehydrogenase